jgi:hypothetical protein
MKKEDETIARAGGIQTTRRGLLVGSTVLLSSSALAGMANPDAPLEPGGVKPGPEFRRIYLEK